ncbi:conserved protein of unknown function [Tenacibaculum sp. 190130A14a]|uniref:Uncharacterized protein n=1 Tax=Tenacibaculum polynesiense TaxID=3137857 RepID=A0ABP1EYQ5_9FLAO
MGILASGTTLALVAPELINLGLKGVKSLVENEQKKYTQSYSKSERNDRFYKNRPADGSAANFSYSGFTITRKVKKSQTITNEVASKLKFNFVLDPDSHTMMAIKPVYAQVNSTKSKLKEKDNTVDLLVNVSIKAYWTTSKDGVPTFNSKEISSVSFNLKNLELGKIYEKKSTKFKNKTSEWFSAVPVSVIDKNIKDYGKFKLEVTVTESDDLKKRFEKFSKRLDASEELLKILLKDAFNVED